MWGIRKRRPTLLSSVLTLVLVASAVGVVVAAWTDGEETMSVSTLGQQDIGERAGQAETAPPTEPRPTAAPISAAQRAFVDPETGRMTSTPSRDLQALSRPPRDDNRNARGLTRLRLSSGAVAVDLEGRFRSSIVATINPDGSVSTRCLKHPDAPEPHDHDHEPTAPAGVEDPS